MQLHPDTFEFVPPTDKQLDKARPMRRAIRECAEQINELCPDGADKTYALRQLRAVYHWAYTAITREQDGSPKQD